MNQYFPFSLQYFSNPLPHDKPANSDNEESQSSKSGGTAAVIIILMIIISVLAFIGWKRYKSNIQNGFRNAGMAGEMGEGKTNQAYAAM